VSSSQNLSEIERQLLMAAAVQGLGPATDLERANTAKVVNQVLRWRGFSAEEVNAGWWDEDFAPEHGAVYEVLIGLVYQVNNESSRHALRRGAALFEGRGNWGVPGVPNYPACSPQFNSCRLTAEGERLANELLKEQPEGRMS
jgi:hypothetical protein